MLFAGILGFGAVVEIRSAFQTMRRTDFGVYARAAWAVRSGDDLYQIRDDRGWHYCYPPLFAMLLTPLADPPADAPREGYLPFSVSVGLWYLFSVGCVGFAVDRMVRGSSSEPASGDRSWWYARTMPVYFCLGGLGFTLARGQVNGLLIALIAGMFLAVVRVQRFRAGLWLAGAITLKVIPAYLVLWLVLMAGRRGLLGLTAGLILFLGVAPAMVWGPGRMISLNVQLVSAVLQPGATGAGDQSRSKELTNSTATDSQSIQAAIHNLKHRDPTTRPHIVEPSTRWMHWGIGLTLTAIVFAISGWLKQQRLLEQPIDQLLTLGVFTQLMLHLTPVSHMHYYALGLPLVTALWHKSLIDRPGSFFADRTTTLFLLGWGIATATPLFPGPVCDRLREIGFGPFASLFLCVFAMARLISPATGCQEHEKTRSSWWSRVRVSVFQGR